MCYSSAKEMALEKHEWSASFPSLSCDATQRPVVAVQVLYGVVTVINAFRANADQGANAGM